MFSDGEYLFPQCSLATERQTLGFIGAGFEAFKNNYKLELDRITEILGPQASFEGVDDTWVGGPGKTWQGAFSAAAGWVDLWLAQYLSGSEPAWGASSGEELPCSNSHLKINLNRNRQTNCRNSADYPKSHRRSRIFT